LIVPEIQALLGKCRPQYRLLYWTAIFTGLRAGEPRALTVKDLNVDMVGLDLSPAWTKNRKPGFQPLPLHTTYANLFLESGAGVKEAMDLARHSTPDMTRLWPEPLGPQG